MKIRTNGRLSVRFLIPITLLALCLTILISVTIGPMAISVTDSFLAVIPDWLYAQNDQPPHITLIIQQVRLPRSLLAVSVGGILALCGTVMQGLFRNSLAEPGTIGVSAGAALGAAVSIVLFGRLLSEFPTLLLFGTVPVFSFLGGALSTLLVYRVGTNRNGTSVTTMLLAGIAISALSGAGLGLMNYYADDQALRDLSLWTLGSLSGSSWGGITLAFSYLILLFVLFYRDADKLNVLLLGEPEARHMGIQLQPLKKRLIVLSAAGVGITVSLAGIIGFIGLVVPHLCRMMSGPNHKSLLPLSMLTGALILLIADILARTLVTPLDMPVGIITALLGAPFFIWLLIQQKGNI